MISRINLYKSRNGTELGPGVIKTFQDNKLYSELENLGMSFYNVLFNFFIFLLLLLRLQNN